MQPSSPCSDGHSGLGDAVEAALTSVGITKDRVERWLGRPCRCDERRMRLNSLTSWAKRVLAGRMQDAVEHLESLTEE